MDFSNQRSNYQASASRITIIAHSFGILALILMLVWLIHYREGIQYDSDTAARVFNVHPFLMYFGFIFLAGEAMMAYKTVPAKRIVQKCVHMLLHLLAFVFGVVGLCAVFKFHDMLNIENMYSIHSWIGLATFCLFGLQWVFGFLTFMLPRASAGTRAKAVPWHICGGRTLLYMAICAALTGLMEKAAFIALDPMSNVPMRSRQSRLMNFTGLSILMFGIFVDLSVGLARYV